MALSYTLVSKCLDNVDDKAGRWQIEGGDLKYRTRKVGNYSSVKRVSCGTEEQNVAMLWMTLFFTGEDPPQNMTLHGAHDFAAGSVGSVSAASPTYALQIGKPFTRVGSTLTIG